MPSPSVVLGCSGFSPPPSPCRLVGASSGTTSTWSCRHFACWPRPGLLPIVGRGSVAGRALLVLCALPALASSSWRPPADRSPLRWMKASRATPRSRPASPRSPTSDERVFVWGNSPQLYVLARRPMGARFSFCNYMTGESPGTPTETGERNADANQLPATWEMLFADLEQRRPACSSTRRPPGGTATASTRWRVTRACAPTSTGTIGRWRRARGSSCTGGCGRGRRRSPARRRGSRASGDR